MTALKPDISGLLDRIAENGVVGAGGAGFPTHVKLAGKVDTLILNAAECEPLLHKDKELLRRYPEQVLAGLVAAGELTGARDVVVGVKGKYTDVIERLRPLLPQGRVMPLHDSYPAGDEFILVYDVTGRVIPPGAIPLAVGCATLNVETAYNIGTGKPVTDKFLTVAGAVKRPVTLRVPVGIRFTEAIALAGGATVKDPRVLVGGVMMGRLALSLDEPVTKTCGGLIVLGPDHMLVRRYESPWKEIARIGASACDQCSFCTEFCPRYLLGHPIEPHKAMRSLCFVEDREPTVIGSQFCCECNLCTMIACPEDLDPKNVCTHNKRQLAEEGRMWRVDAHLDRASLHLDNRRIPISRLIRKLGLSVFTNDGPLEEPEYRPARVFLPLKQHAGAPAEPVVSSGARVRVGDVIARPPKGALGAVIHASIDGVCEASKDQDQVIIAAAG